MLILVVATAPLSVNSSLIRAKVSSFCIRLNMLTSPLFHSISRVLGLSVARRIKIKFVAAICLHFLELHALFLAKSVSAP
ncbi:hypothetical protein BDR06DRAFT_406705 [Suillus hirtellus]|nr:hypothetical protein BDR06DRAFT_406705 [Suillus hirtellus]